MKAKLDLYHCLVVDVGGQYVDKFCPFDHEPARCGRGCAMFYETFDRTFGHKLHLGCGSGMVEYDIVEEK